MADRANRIAELRKKAGLTQAELAERVGAHWITISKLERGKMYLTFEWAERLGKALGVGEFDVFKEDMEADKTVFIEGAVADKGKIFFYRNEEGKDEYEAIRLPIGTHRIFADIWLQIETEDFFPFLNIGDLVRLSYLEDSERPKDYVGRMMAARSKDDLGIYMGILAPSLTPGKFEIRALNGAPRQELEIEALLAVSLIVPMPPVHDRKTTENSPPIT